MQLFTLILFCVVTTVEYIVQRTGLPVVLRYLPEMLSGVVLLYVLVAGTIDRFQMVASKYWMVLCGIALVTVCGVINNAPGPGSVLTGLRYYFRATPVFLLPMVMPVSEELLKRQLKVIFGICLLQIPVAMYQRWIVYSTDRVSGDEVRGTIMDSGVLSMFLICAALIVTGLVLKRRISVFRYAIMFLLLLFPTTLNETKVTVVLVPFGMFVTFVIGADPGKRLRYAGLSALVLVLFGSIFVPIYNTLEEGQVNIVDFFTSQKTLNKYLVAQSGTNSVGVGSRKMATRGESISVPLKYLAKDPVLLAFGLGLGNVSPSQSGKNFEGAYFPLFQGVLTLSMTFFILEFGLFGVFLILLLNVLIFLDCVAVTRGNDTLTGAVAAGWTGVIAIFLLSMFYNNYHFFAAVTYPYWYVSGLMCARRIAMRRDAVAPADRAVILRTNAVA